MASSSSSSPLFLPISPQQKHEVQKKYNVFLSFRGEDTRNKFFSHLDSALSAKYISTFMDDHELQVGDEISPTLGQAIQNSKILVIIFSENYASSTWCLNELVEILECKKRNEQSVVIPIFYEIDPSDVRKQKGSYKLAIVELEERFKDGMEKVHQWRVALTEASNLSGLNSTTFRGESELVQEIVKNILERLLQYQSSDEHYFKGLIGIKENIKKIERILSIDSKDVRIIGIWGMAGIGKTTLAKVVFQKLSNSQLFEGCYFLEDVREKIKVPGGLDHLRKNLICCLLNDKTIQKMDTPLEALPSIIFQRLRRKKVLIVLDDVDSSIQLNVLVEGCCELAPGCRIIVTTRDKQVLRIAADSIYQVKSLNVIESLELFRLHAFRENSPTIDDEMVLEVIRYADGNPLAFKVLGSFLCCRSQIDWESALKKLKRVQDSEIEKVLKVSYNGLDKGTKEIFLDTACLFNSFFTRGHVERILGGGNSTVEIELWMHDLLWMLWMHDLLRQMGPAIVCDEDKEPGNHSRLCNAVEVCDVLENCTGTAAVEVISLDMSEIKKNVIMGHGAFSNMRNLRILKVSYGHDDTTKNEWIHNHVEKLWNSRKVMSLPVLKRMDLSYSEFLTQLLDLTQAPNLERINLEGCTSLVQAHISQKFAPNLRYLGLNETAIETVPPSIGSGLVKLDLKFCKRLKSLPTSICHLKSVESLRLCGCKKLKGFPEILEPMVRLITLYLSLSGIRELPESIENLVSLEVVLMDECKDLEFLSNGLCKLRNLRLISLFDCSKIEKLPPIPPSLNTLCVDYCQRLKSLPEVPSQYLSVSACHCTSLENISNIRSVSPFLEADPLAKKPRSCPDYFEFYGCGKLNQNTRNMLADEALIHILHRLHFGSTALVARSVYFFYPGDEIPELFNHQTCGTSIDNIVLPPNRNYDNFLAFACCIVLHQNINCKCISLEFHWKSNSKTFCCFSEYGFFRFQHLEHRKRRYMQKLRRLIEGCESSGSEAIDSLEEEDDDEPHFKKLNVMGLFISLWSKRFNYIMSLRASAVAVYSASVMDKATDFCNIDCRDIAPPVKV
ncbi:disease resistance protein RPV1-like [Ziziphus jujuba]|uniref:ADP-ribosyl cyclase/cyclic ADP-ribose hydrolase n=1 Tax=Ziziphus jujuba TaxID=326968 RepID=A0ABM4AB47_ZIZJJ|nr:disease resistance protein RPV1-like [Ziziphus jujuba]